MCNSKLYHLCQDAQNILFLKSNNFHEWQLIVLTGVAKNRDSTWESERKKETLEFLSTVIFLLLLSRRAIEVILHYDSLSPVKSSWMQTAYFLRYPPSL